MNQKNNMCKRCKIPMRKKGSIKIEEKRFKCPKCGKEK